jgi:hypothetical protein
LRKQRGQRSPSAQSSTTGTSERQAGQRIIDAA